MENKRLGIVILNYINYWDTIECVDSILDMKYAVCGITIVDNHSDNNSVQQLNEKYGSNPLINIICTKKNLGFAKGNNAGIRNVRDCFGAEFVFVVNNDTVFVDPLFFDTLLGAYKEGVGIIGPKIQLKNGTIQPELKEDISFKYCRQRYVRDWMRLHVDNVWLFLAPNPKRNATVKILHGCALLFTPDFLSSYEGFYPGTFLYNEEPILWIMCKMKNLSQKYVKDTYLYHKEDQSSEASFENKSEIMRKYNLQSRKHLLRWTLKYNLWTKMKKSR